jgi:hypothetical protein
MFKNIKSIESVRRYPRTNRCVCPREVAIGARKERDRDQQKVKLKMSIENSFFE